MKNIRKAYIKNQKNKYNQNTSKNANYKEYKAHKTRKYDSETNSLINNNKYKKLKKVHSKNKYILIIILFILFLIISLIIIAIIYKRKNLIDVNNDNNNEEENNSEEENEEENIQPDNETIYYEEKFDSYIDAFNKSKDFINNSLNGILLNTEKRQLFKKPNVSVVIPCYNCKNNILSCIRSIENQNFSNFEIIIVDDASSNETSLYLEQLQKEERIIKIINNKKNMGTLYTRSIGTFSSKGKYIFPMDSDDMLLNKDVLSTITNIAYKGNFDIVTFNSVCSDLKPNVYQAKIHLSEYEGKHYPNLVLYQPDLGNFPISLSNKLNEPSINEVLIRPKCIKSKIYKEALYKLGEERYSRHMLLGEDDIAVYIVFNIAKIAKFVPLYGYLYIDYKESISKSQKDRVQHAIYLLYIFDVMIDFSLNFQNNKKVLVSYILFIFNNKFLKEALNRNVNNTILLNSCLDRVFNCSLISDENKEEIRRQGKNLDFIKYHF